jgi:hypothetical protein
MCRQPTRFDGEFGRERFNAGLGTQWYLLQEK